MARHRMIISLDSELYQLFKNVSELTSTPSATIAYELLSSLRGKLKEMEEALRLVKEGQNEAAVSVLNKMASNAVQDIDGLKKDLNQETKKK